jgi:hypothetical protein
MLEEELHGGELEEESSSAQSSSHHRSSSRRIWPSQVQRRDTTYGWELERVMVGWCA